MFGQVPQLYIHTKLCVYARGRMHDNLGRAADRKVSPATARRDGNLKLDSEQNSPRFLLLVLSLIPLILTS